MISQIFVRTVILAGFVVALTATSIVSAQTRSVDPAVDASGKTVIPRTSGLTSPEKETRSEVLATDSEVAAVSLKKGEEATPVETAKAEPSVRRDFRPDETATPFGTPVVGSEGKPATPPKQNSTGSDWQVAFAPYLYATGISGKIGANGQVVDVDASFGNVLENLDLGLMGTLEARKGKLIFVSDLVWTKMSAERDTPGGLYSTAKVGVNLFIFDPEVGYRVAESKAGSFDVLGGVRIWSVENNLNLTTGTLPGFDVSQRKTWAAPVVGFHGLLNLSPKVYLSTKFDIGGAGIGADLTTQFYGGAGYRVTPKIALIGGYRFLQVDYDDSNGFLFDTKMNGFVFGAKFNF